MDDNLPSANWQEYDLRSTLGKIGLICIIAGIVLFVLGGPWGALEAILALLVKALTMMFITIGTIGMILGSIIFILGFVVLAIAIFGKWGNDAADEVESSTPV